LKLKDEKPQNRVREASPVLPSANNSERTAKLQDALTTYTYEFAVLLIQYCDDSILDESALFEFAEQCDTEYNQSK
jgi:hypothetical protein